MNYDYSDNYKKLVSTILNEGTIQEARNGTQLIIPHYSFTLDLSSGQNHILKLRKYFVKGVEGEFKTLLSRTNPLTNVKQFEANGCNYWVKWAKEDGALNLDYYNQLHPALDNVIDQIKKDPYSRRHVISLWDNENAFNDSLSLHCCWHNLTFTVIDRTLHLTWTQRSVDTMVGLPADIYLSFLFMAYIAKLCDLKVGTCMYSLSNVHIYTEHVTGAYELLTRTTEDFDKPLAFLLKE